MKLIGTLTLAAGAITLGGFGCDEGGDSGPMGSNFNITVAPLEANSDACYHVEVFGAGAVGVPAYTDLVWEEDLCSGGAAPSFGVAGDLRYVGVCDSGTGTKLNTVRLTVTDLTSAGVDLVVNNVEFNGFINPCPVSAGDNGCVIVAQCNQLEDTQVDFDITVMQQAPYGFFDIAVRFDETFCAAKLDCEDDEQNALKFFQDPDPLASGADVDTVVVGFACQVGGEVPALFINDINIHCQSSNAGNSTSACTSNADCLPNTNNKTCDLVLGTCASRTATVYREALLQPEQGNVVPYEEPVDVNPLNNILFGAALNQGAGVGGLLYANVMLGMRYGNAPSGEVCTLTTTATAQGATSQVTAGGLLGYETPENVNYPYVSWEVPLYNSTGRTCTQHPLGGENGVEALYTGTTTQQEFEYTFAD